jgi:hypothetical protein
MARSDQEQVAEHARRHRWASITVIGIAVVSGSALLAVPAIAAGVSPDRGSGAGSTATYRVVVCESGVIDHGDGIQTSSARAERVAADAPVPAGCTAR